MPYLVEIIAEGKRADRQLIAVKKCAEDRYFRAFAAVSQKSPVRAEDGKYVSLIGCFLFEVSTNQMSVAIAMVRENEARRLQSSDDPGCGEPIVVEGLLKVIH